MKWWKSMSKAARRKFILGLVLIAVGSLSISGFLLYTHGGGGIATELPQRSATAFSMTFSDIKELEIDTRSVYVSIMKSYDDQIHVELSVPVSESATPAVALEHSFPSEGALLLKENDNGMELPQFGRTGYDLSVRIPPDQLENLRIHQRAGNAYVSDINITGKLDFEVESGYAGVYQMTAEEINADIASGSMSINETVVIGKTSLKGASGNLDVSNLTTGEFEADMRSGDQNFREITVEKDFDLKSTSGYTNCINVSADKATIKRSSGTLVFTGTCQDIDYKSTSGAATITSLCEANVSAETKSGSLSLVLPASMNGQMNLDINKTSGSVQNNFFTQKVADAAKTPFEVKIKMISGSLTIEPLNAE